MPGVIFVDRELDQVVDFGGHQGDRVFTGGIGAMILLIGLLNRISSGSVYSALAVGLAVVAGAITCAAIQDFLTVVVQPNDWTQASLGVGMCFTPPGVLFALVAGLSEMDARTGGDS